MAESDIITGQYVQICQTPASIGERIGAQLIDWIVLLGYGYTVTWFISMLPSTAGGATFLIELLLVVLPILFYCPLCEQLNHGQTLGKQLLRLRVVRKDGSPATLGCSLLRWLLFIADGPLLSFVGVLVILLTPHRQRLGDLAAGTLVIRIDSYNKIQVSLDEFSHLSRDYHPVYPQAADLSLEQVNLISKTLLLDDDDPRVHALAAKVQQVLGISQHKESDDHAFLWRLQRDYQFYALEEI